MNSFILFPSAYFSKIIPTIMGFWGLGVFGGLLQITLGNPEFRARNIYYQGGVY